MLWRITPLKPLRDSEEEEEEEEEVKVHSKETQPSGGSAMDIFSDSAGFPCGENFPLNIKMQCHHALENGKWIGFSLQLCGKAAVYQYQ